MAGAHRRGGQPGGGWTSVRWLLAVAATVAIPALALGLFIYFLVVGTNLELTAGTLVGSVALFTWALIKRRADWSNLCFAAGLVGSTTWELVSTVAHRDKWPTADLWVIGMTGDCLRLATIVFLAVSLLTGIRSGRLSWPPWRTTPQDNADPW